jgi:hypothetical protein
VSPDAATLKATYTKATKFEVVFKHGVREATLTATLGKSDDNAGTLKLVFNNNFLNKFKKVSILSNFFCLRQIRSGLIS